MGVSSALRTVLVMTGVLTLISSGGLAAQTEITTTASFTGFLGVDPEQVVEGYQQTLGPDGLVNEYRLAIAPDREVRIELESDDFDTYLTVVLPNGARVENDDSSGTNSAVTAFDTMSGEWTIRVTAFDGTGEGAYTLTIRPGPAGNWTPFSGTLRSTSTRTPKGAWYESVPVQAEAGERLRASVTNPDGIDLGLVFQDPSGLRVVQRFADGMGRTELEFLAVDRGEHTLLVFSEYLPENEELGFSGSLFRGDPDVATGETLLDEEGSLSDTDPIMVTGESFDTFEIDVEEVDGLRFEVSADEFDTYLVVESPTGRRYSNDDANSTGATWTSICSIAVSADDRSGRWTVYVTSYADGEAGDYRLQVGRVESPAFDGDRCEPN